MVKKFNSTVIECSSVGKVHTPLEGMFSSSLFRGSYHFSKVLVGLSVSLLKGFAFYSSNA